MDLTPKKASESEASLTHIVRSEDLNMHGHLFGGKMLSFMDTCSAITAMRHSRRNCVTACISDVDFIAPVRMGHILHLTARLHFTARTSMEVAVKAECEDHMTGDCKEVCRAFLTFIALDNDNQPTEVPPVELETAQDRQFNAQARERYEERKAARAKR